MVEHPSTRCQFCGDPFVPHAKVGPRQIACEKTVCKQARIKWTHRQWYKKNPGYNYDNVKRYREAHPDYQKQWRQRKKRKQQDKSDIGTAPKTSRLLTSEIQNQLSPGKTKAQVEFHQACEIQNQLTFYFSLPLSQFLQSLPKAQRREIQNQLTN